MANKGKKILIVDDDIIVKEMYGQKLELEGYNVVFAANARDGLSLVESEGPDLIFVDVMMPNEDGFWFLDGVKSKKDPNISEIPVIILTNFDDHESREKCARLGCLFYLVKPQHVPSDLVRIADELLLDGPKQSQQ